MDRADYSRVEAGKLAHLTIGRASRIGAVLGLDVSVKAYPGASAVRDVAQASRLQRLIANVGRPLTWRAEVPLPRTTDRVELRSHDLVLFGDGERTAVEHEAKLYDIQAQLRRFALKQRDDPTEHFLLVVADRRANRRILRVSRTCSRTSPGSEPRWSSPRCDRADTHRAGSSSSEPS